MNLGTIQSYSETGKRLKVVLPYDGFASKNRAKFVKDGKIRKDSRHAKWQDDLILLVRNAYQNSGLRFEDEKRVRIDIVLTKTSGQARVDAPNLVDAVCDSVSKAIQIDDLWFAGSWDWVVGEDKLVEVSVWQSE